MKSTGICRWLFLLISLTTWTTTTSSKEMRVVCYYTNWSVYRPGAAKFSPQNINPYLCTHLVYAFGGFTKENRLKPFDKYQDIEKGGYAKFTGLKTYNKNLKTLLAIGGWNEGSSRFSPMVANPERRKELVKNAIKFLRQNHFDGLDLDWEYPSFRDGGKPRDRDNYAQLVQELREEFDRESEKTGRPRLLLTMAVPAGIEYINKGYDIPKLTKYLDWMNILSYDYHSAFEPAVNHHAPLYSLEEDNEYNYDAELNIDYTIKHYLKLGADPDKLVLGIPTYGRSYTLFNPDANAIGAPADGPGEMGEATRENGYMAYYEICDYVKNQGWQEEQPNPDAMGPYAYKDNQWVGYDDEAIARKKSEYVAENGLGGIMFWAIDNDDFRGTCHGRPYPLIEAAKEALMEAYGLTDANLISPPSKPIKSKPRARPKPTSKPKPVEEEAKPLKIHNRRRNRNKSKAKEEDRPSAVSRLKPRRKEPRTTTTTASTQASTYSSLKVTTPSYTTPAPPSTPDLDGAFKCEEDGFFPHPKDCKKYFWCLSGAGDTGITAHAFTCPAGLYFNKAADSCDYAQNVLCNKKLQKPVTAAPEKTSSSTTTTTTTAAASPSTSRAPPKITAATSRTTFKQSTTTEAYEDDDYEYEDEEEEKSNDDEDSKSASEEDPKVIKELIDLIKKAGGIEELEKQLSKGGPSGKPGLDTTTQTAISKSLYERVLSKAKNSLNARKPTPTGIRNSRGPQNDGLSKAEEKPSRGKTERGKLQYTSISRKRPSTEKSVEDETDEEEEGEEVKDETAQPRRLFNKKSQPEYVTIRRPRVSSTTEASDTSGVNRNKILGEVLDDDDDEEYDDEEEEDDDDIAEDEAPKKTFSPQYVNIRRQRPSTTEASSTSKYKEIRRGTTTEATTEANDDTDGSKYKILRRGSTTTVSPTTVSTEETNSSKYQLLRRGTTPTTATTPTDDSTSKYKNFRRGGTTEKPSSEPEEATSKYKQLRRGTTASTTASSSTTEDAVNTGNVVRNLTSPTDEENYVTPSLEAISGSTTATASEPTLTTVSNSPVESSLGSSTTSTSSTTPSSTSQDPTTNSDINLVDEAATTKKESSVPATEKYPETTKSDAGDATTAEARSPSVSTTEPTGIDPTTIKQRPRPFSSIGRSTARPAAEPSSTTQAAKVSQSKFKLRSRPKPLHKDVVSKQAVPTTDTPNTTIKPRGRGLPRTTTERPAEERTYRPTELADFSSLTAVDFAQIKELDAAQTTHRRRRPTTTPPTTTISSNVEDEKDTDKTPPPEAKPERGRRITSKKLDSIELDASATTRSGRGFGFRSTRTPTATTESAENAIKEGSVNVTPRGRRVVRRFRTTTKSANGIGETLNKTSTEAPAIKRGKFFTAQNRNQSSLLKTPRGSKNPLQRLFNKKPTRLPYGLQRNNVEEESDDSLEDTSTEEGENIKLSESNIRENSDVNSFDTSGKQRRKLVKLVRQKSDNLHAKNTQLPGKTTTESSKTTTTKNSEVITTTTQEAATTDAVTEQGTTTVRRGKDTESFTTIQPESTSATKTTESTENKTKSKSSLFRTRKVIRKLKPKAITTATSVENNSNRRRKLIRRRPVTATTEDKKDEESVNATTITTAATTTSDNATTDNATSDADNTTTTANPGAEDATTTTTTTPATTLRSRGINRLTTVPIESTTSAVKEETPKRLIRPFNRPKIRPYGRAPTSSTSRSTTVSGSTPEPSKESGRRVFRPRLGAIPRRTVPNRVRPPPRTTTRQPVDATEDTTVGREVTTTLNYPSRRRLPKRPGFGTTTTDAFTTEPVTELTAETMPATVKNYEEPTTTERGMETSTMFSETMESKDEDGNVKVVKSSTSIYNLYKPLNGEKDFDSEEDTKKNDTVDPMDKRNYVSVFRSSTTSNSFDNFDSEFDETHPHLRDDSDESYLDSAYGDDGYDTELEGGHGDGDDDDEDQTDEADTVDTSTEYRPARRGSSYSPIDDFAQYESMAESSSVRNRFTKPDKLPADRVTPSPKKGPKPRQKFKTITKSSNKSILKETIQIHSFNDSDPHGKMAEVVVNRFKYRTLERTTVLPDLETSSEDSSESSDEATIPIDLTTLLNLDESNESTQSGEEQDDKYDSMETTEDSSEKTENYKSAETTEKYSEEVTLPNPEVSTNLNAEYRENEIIEYSTATNEISTQRQFTTTEDAPQTESNQITSTTSATVVELNDIDTTTRGSVEEVTSTAGTTIEDTTVEGSTETEMTETPTTTTPKVTTPYQRRSTLRPIESRPKFTPIRRKSSYLGTSTTEASNRSFNRFNRNRFKSTTEEADKPVKRTRNRFSYRQSSTTEKPNPIEDDDNKDEEKGDSVTENVIEDDSSVTKPLPTTTAVPLSDFIYSYTTTEAAQVNEESVKLEEQEEEKVDDKNEGESSEDKGEEEKGEEETEIEKEEKEEKQEEKGEGETKVEKEEKEEQEENEEREQKKEEKQEEEKETKEEKVEEKVVKKPVRPSVNFRPRLPGSKPRVANRPPSGRRPPNSPIRSNGPYFGRSTTPRVINKPKFAKTTETPKAEEDLSGIDTEALKNRNKNLYSKKRVPNRPVTPSTTTAAAETAEPPTEIPEEITTEPGVSQDRITTATPITEAVTKPSSVETTEFLTTLHHIFSAVDDDTTKNRTETTTEALSAPVTATTGKVEKLIEVSRIVKVKTKGAKVKNHNVVEEQSTSEVAPVKIGLVNRVTSIKVVGGNDTDSSLSEAAATTENAHTSIGIPAKVEEIPASEVQAKVNLTDIRVTINNIADLLHTHREDRKIDGVGDNDNRLTSGEKAQVIDGKSHINVFTPRPLFATEASTIALEGLFQTESPEQSAATPKPLNSVANDEILETENSRFVNVRVLHQDDKPTKGINDNSKLFPVKILPQDDEQLLRAEVVEVTPLYHVEPIRIVPIKVEMSKRVVDSVPVYRVGPQT